MRWDDLFADLEAQFWVAESMAVDTEVADRTRYEFARLRLVDRLRGAIGQEMVLGTAGAGAVRGRLVDVGSQWVIIEERPERQALVVLSAVLTATGFCPRSAPPGADGPVVARLGVGHALRRLARDRLPVRCVLRDSTVVAGTIDRVGSDFLEIAEHPADEPRRQRAVEGIRAITFEGLSLVRGG